MIPNFAVSEWTVVSQEQIDRFAEATGDRQWLHIDPMRAARESPYGGTVAHGFLTLALMSELLRESVPLHEFRMAVNYGLNRVRFLAPVIAGTRIRARFDLASIDEKKDASKVTWNVTMESEQAGRPCCVAEWIVLYYR